MTLLAVERIKLFSTRSPWWCTVVALGLTIGFAALLATQVDQTTLRMTQFGYQFGLMVVLVMAALSVTTEYRFGTIRATFQAVPNRVSAMLAKVAVVAVFAFVVGELAAFGSWGVVSAISPESDLAISNIEQLRQVGGVGLVFAVGSVLAISVGALLRQTAGAVTLLMIWSMLVESLVTLIPSFGPDVQQWMPFTVADNFLSAGSGNMAAQQIASSAPLGPWGSLAYFAAIAAAMLAISLVVVQRRDA
ncbi:hypothetical protein [Parasphingorhabdus pacifica]